MGLDVYASEKRYQRLLAGWGCNHRMGPQYI